MPPEAQQALQGMQQKLMAINAHSQQVEKRLAQLVQEKQAKIIDNQFKQAMQTMDQQTQLAIAWIKAKVDVGTQLGEQEWKELELIHNSALEAAKLAAQHAHEFSMAQFEAENQPEPATLVQ
jgi:urocanate hydratase